MRDESTRPRAVVLLSGGLDSATAAAIAKSEGYELYAISFSYGQRHSKEIECARRVGERLGVARHVVTEFDLRLWGGSALTDDLEVPLDRHHLEPPRRQERQGRQETDETPDIPITYVPARNTIFLSFALGFAEVVGADTIVIGVNQLDYSGYPDCRGEYLEAFERMANLATKAGTADGRHIRIYAPLLDMTKAEIIRRGLDLGVDYSLTWSCYQGLDEPCGRCDSCILRAEGFRAAGTVDPAVGVLEQ